MAMQTVRRAIAPVAAVLAIAIGGVVGSIAPATAATAKTVSGGLSGHGALSNDPSCTAVGVYSLAGKYHSDTLGHGTYQLRMCENVPGSESTGTLEMVTSNGSLVHAVIDGSLQVGPSIPTQPQTLQVPVTIVGGTQRFTGATGSLNVLVPFPSCTRPCKFQGNGAFGGGVAMLTPTSVTATLTGQGNFTGCSGETSSFSTGTYTSNRLAGGTYTLTLCGLPGPLTGGDLSFQTTAGEKIHASYRPSAGAFVVDSGTQRFTGIGGRLTVSVTRTPVCDPGGPCLGFTETGTVTGFVVEPLAQ